MTRLLKLVALDRAPKGAKEILLRLTPALNRDYKGAYIHLPSLTRVRLKVLKERETGPNVRIRGLARERLKKGDRFLALDEAVLAGRRFYGRLVGLGIGDGGEGVFQGTELAYRIIAPETQLRETGMAVLETTRPLALVPGKEFKLPGGGFIPLALNIWNPDADPKDLLNLQGWQPAGLTAAEGTAARPFRFSPAWLDWVRGRLAEASRREGGLPLSRIPELLTIPAYLADELQRFLSDEGEFSFSEGVLLDLTWDYSQSLSPMAKGLLSELNAEGVMVEKIPDAPRQRALRLLVRSGLAEEFEEGIFISRPFFEETYAKVGALRQEEPHIGLSELAARTGVKKRFLIPLLQHGDLVL